MGNGVNTDILIIYKFNQCTNSFTVDQQLLICKRLFLIQWGFCIGEQQRLPLTASKDQSTGIIMSG